MFSFLRKHSNGILKSFTSKSQYFKIVVFAFPNFISIEAIQSIIMYLSLKDAVKEKIHRTRALLIFIETFFSS